MHADDFRKDLYGIMSGLRDGGYSDDMTLAAIAGMFMNTLLILGAILSSFSDKHFVIITQKFNF